MSGLNPIKAWLSAKIPSVPSPTILLATGATLGVVLPLASVLTPSKTAAVVSQPQLVAQNPRTVELTLVSFAVTQQAFSKVIPLFTQKWKKEKNQTVVFRQSYGGSGSQARAVVDGLEADVVMLALGFDVDRIQKAGLIKPNWQKEVPNNGIVTKSVVALLTRQGNPKKITQWQDLSKPGVSIITANPKTSGVARWNFLGLWGSVTQTGGNEGKAKQYVTQVFKNVPVLAKDAREATDIFLKQQQGDVLLNYENEAILASQQGQKGFSWTVPKNNISIENPVAVVDSVVDKRKTRAVADAFVKFLFTPEAQREFAKTGFRPTNSTVAREYGNKFPKINKLYTVNDFGGWAAVQQKFFTDGGIFDQIQAGRR
ncbi:MAG: Sulfate-binding protein [Chroococcopsis gigantea SAG 12.99]|jgi:sulfate/thiosulfate-binding protein|nr:sulfate ABC transporter substrate-binding protein [Chlorogloea purpurea SAG 13.99]MDV2999942.1 Sulfate-binding protein [Chroococcopsis gigantea SAG 12.99]